MDLRRPKVGCLKEKGRMVTQPGMVGKCRLETNQGVWSATVLWVLMGYAYDDRLSSITMVACFMQ